jgi:hypothetical protein
MTLSIDVATQKPRHFNLLNFVRMLSGSCNNSTFTSRNRISIMVGRLDYTNDNLNEADVSKVRVSGVRITNYVQAICVPRYNIKTTPSRPKRNFSRGGQLYTRAKFTIPWYYKSVGLNAVPNQYCHC